MAHDRARRQPIERRARRVVQRGGEIIRVERQRRHALPHLPFPELARTVGVDLDSVVVGIAKVERLADEVVGHSDELHAVARGVREPVRQIAPIGHEQCEVVQPREPVGGFRTALFYEHEQVLPTCAERRARVLALTHREPDLALVVVDRTVEVGDGQVNRAEPRGGGNRRGRRLLGIELAHPISMPQDRPPIGVRSDVENHEPDERPEKPPGHFMEETYETDTKRFVEQARELARRRAAERPAWDEDERA